jgi:DNA-binding response OmpR family regulator
MTRVKVLIVEDDLMIADVASEFLSASGYEVCGIARTVSEAVALSRTHRPDLALIDLRLARGGIGTEIVRQLPVGERPGILYATGNVSQFVLTKNDGEASISKPYSAEDLVRSLEIVGEIVATGIASTPFPRGFRVLPPPKPPAGPQPHG